ncbi:hypothetical protein LTR64_003411 [Lithohypha guttulata]|uniref:Importin N-terminal domain-containing protein n=1 Tax=Lithohypha guttulata TaxID=1690604 RepID=A0AAN7YAR0_9EURO|nr:hypothetical protein LTR51_000371 [Lithohypha guttulata]KAK5085561.1 hypothetical protein LTR05_004847 [Lithohypha guttulata]
MAWQPQQEGLQQLSELLKDSLSGNQREKQKQAEQTLQQAANSPDYSYYLTYIFYNPEIGSTFLVRYAAAIQLKNHIKLNYKSIPKDQLAFVKQYTLQTLRDANPQLRSFAGTIITEIVQQGGILQWPEVLQDLISLVESTASDVTPDVQEAAMSALAKVCEDNRKLLDKEYSGQRPTTVIIPKMLDFAGHNHPKIRVLAVQTLRAFILQKSQILFDHLDVYLQKIFQLATDEDVGVRRTVCQSLVQLVEMRPDMLAPHMEGLVNYILMQQQQSAGNPELALDAAEFWLSVGEETELRDLMGPYLERTIPILLAGMVYGEEDILRLGGDEQNADVDDRAEDIKPQFAQTKAGRGALAQTNGENGTHPNQAQKEKQDMSDGEIEDDEDEDDDWDEDGNPEEAWSLRKCSAAALDVFAVHYHGDVFNIILPYLRENLSHALWPKREAAVLALGAIAEGCLPVVAPHLPELVPFLINLLSDEEPVVRVITCWCLSRYSEWAAELPDPADVQKYFEPMMDGLLQRMLDKNKKVQEAGASSFASLEEKAGARLKPYVEPILRQFVLCFERYKDKNMYILYDCLQTLADSVHSEMAKPELVDLLMPVLINRWNKIDDQSREMFPLLGCLSYIAIAYGPNFSQFADPIFDRCMKMIYDCLQQHMSFTTGATVDKPDKDFVVSALDLLSAVIQAIDTSKSGLLVTNAQPPFYDLLSFCMEDPTDDVRQSAYALLGDSAIMLFNTLEPQLPKLMPILIRQLDLNRIRDEDSDNAFNVVINVCWSAGEVVARAGPKFQPFIEPLYQGLIEIVKNEEVPDGANENAAITLGRMGLACPDQMAAHLPEVAGPFLDSMSKVASTEEKASAFLGFNNMIQRNPKAMEGSLTEYFTAIAQFPYKQQDSEYAAVKQSFGLVIQGYNQLIPDFGSFVARLAPNVQQKLRHAYSL